MNEKINVFLSAETIEARIEELAKEISKEFDGETITMISVLKGSVVFMVDLAKQIKGDVHFEFMEVSSYGDSTVSSGIVKIAKDLTQPITGKNVLLVEDIIDTGKTLGFLLGHLQAQMPEKLKVCTLLDKPSRREVYDCVPDFVGFEIPDEFVIGYGLDYAQKYRNLPYIGVLSFEE